MKRSFQKSRIIPFLFTIILLVIFGCKDEKEYSEVPEEPEVAEVTEEEKVKRGEYLVATIGCADCHSPKAGFGPQGPQEIKGRELSGFQQGNELPKIDMSTLPPGHMVMNGDLTAAVGPWGTSFAANITSHETGIGSWSLEQFETAMRKGKYKGLENARDLLPPMPWFNFAKLSDEDLEAMYYYLQSTEPVDNVVPAPIPPGGAVAAN